MESKKGMLFFWANSYKLKKASFPSADYEWLQNRVHRSSAETLEAPRKSTQIYWSLFGGCEATNFTVNFGKARRLKRKASLLFMVFCNLHNKFFSSVTVSTAFTLVLPDSKRHREKEINVLKLLHYFSCSASCISFHFLLLRFLLFQGLSPFIICFKPA